MVHINPSDPRKQITSQNLESINNSDSKKIKKSESKPVSKDDQVVLSSMAKDIQVVKKHLGEISPERMEKLKEIAQKIASGEYKVEPEKIAQKMIQEMKKQ